MELVDRVVPPKPSAEEIREGKPKREAYRNQLLSTQQTLLKLKDEVSNPLGISQKELDTEVEKSLAWINVNIEVSPAEVEVKQTSFNETFYTLQQKYIDASAKAFEKDPKQEIVNRYPFPEGRKALQSIMNGKLQDEKIKKRKQRDEQSKRTYFDDANDALGNVLKWSLITFVVVYALRSASFAANQNLYLPLPYRVLKFLYTFIFFPIWIPYYLYREIKHAIWPCIDEPHFESVFPVQPYNPVEGLDLNKRFFGYPNIPELCEWIQKKKDAWKEQKEKVLEGNLFETLLAEKKEMDTAA
jgi:hypothetical protein